MVLCGAWQSAGGATLVQKGKSDYVIRVPTNAIASEEYAASELQGYMEKIGGVRLPIGQNAGRRGREIVIARDESLGVDGFTLRTEGNRVVITGARPRGALYGVYTLLEEQFGVRWFAPEVEFVPRTNRLVLGKLSIEKKPALEYREVFWTEMMRDADFAARHRLNGNSYKLQAKHGGRFAVYFPFVHSFDELIPQSLFAEHPEYFPVIDGKRTGGYVQRCLSNPDVVKLSKERVRQWIRDHPEATIISVSQNDTGKWCRCADCEALDQAEGTPCASLLKFVNAIAENIEKDHPQVRIDTLAYQYTRKPPKTIRPRANVIVRLCSIECCFAHPLGNCDSEANVRFRSDMVAWQPVAPLLYVWDYTPNFAHYLQPFPNFAAIQQNVQFFVKHGVKGLFEQGNYSPGGQGELGPLRSYLLAKLLWDPNADVARHQEEFLRGYYGPASVKVGQYVGMLTAQAKPGVHAHIYDPPTARYLNAEFIAQADAVLAEAEALVSGPEQQRVQVARLPVWYVQLAANHVKGEQRKAVLARFLEVARKAKISHISEGQALEDWAKKQG